MKRKEYVESMSREDEEKGREEKQIERRFKTQRRLAPFTNREKQEYVSK